MSCPLAFYVLQKLSAPRGLGRAILLPVQHKLRDCLLGKLAIYIGHLQHIIHRFFGLPLRWHRTGH